jgi:hypothetical protein
MEDALLLLPVNGWDIAQLVEAGEINILRRLLTLPVELRYTRRGMRLMEEREQRLWEQRMQKAAGRRDSAPDASVPATASPPPVPSCPYRDPSVRGCGLYVVFDGHKGPSAANFFSSRVVDTFHAICKEVTTDRKATLKTKKKLGWKNKKKRRAGRREAFVHTMA